MYVYRVDKELVLEPVRQNGFACHVAAELKGDEELLLEVAKHSGSIFQYNYAEVKGNTEYVLKVRQKHGWALQCVSAELTGAEEVVVEAVKQHA